MAAPCLANGDCVNLSMVDGNLRADLVLDPSANNAAVCGPDGLFVPRSRSRYVEGTSNVPSGVDGVSTGLAGISIDVEDFEAGNAAGTPIEITNTTTLTYTNTTAESEMCSFEFVMGQAEFDLRGGWQFDVGLKTSWSGPAALTPVSSLRTNVGFQTGLSAFDLAYDSLAFVDPAGATFPQYVLGQMTVIAPGETLQLQWRMWARYLATGLPNAGSSQAQSVSVLFGSLARIRTWTQG